MPTWLDCVYPGSWHSLPDSVVHPLVLDTVEEVAGNVGVSVRYPSSRTTRTQESISLNKNGIDL